MSSSKGSETLLKNFFLLGIGVVVLGLFSQFFGGNSIGYGSSMGHGYNSSLGLGGFLPGLLMIIVKVLWLVMLIALVIGFFFASKKYLGVEGQGSLNFNSLVKKINGSPYPCPNCNAELAEEFKFCPSCKITLKNNCSCGKELQVGWRYCPRCGREHLSQG